MRQQWCPGVNMGKCKGYNLSIQNVRAFVYRTLRVRACVKFPGHICKCPWYLGALMKHSWSLGSYSNHGGHTSPGTAQMSLREVYVSLKANRCPYEWFPEGHVMGYPCSLGLHLRGPFSFKGYIHQTFLMLRVIGEPWGQISPETAELTLRGVYVSIRAYLCTRTVNEMHWGSYIGMTCSLGSHRRGPVPLMDIYTKEVYL